MQGFKIHNNIRNGGFTLIELMVVIVILGVLAGLIVPRIMGRPDEARQLKAKMQIESLETALKLYKLDNGSYPTTDQGLEALVTAPDTPPLPRKWRDGGYLEKGKVPVDPWGNTLVEGDDQERQSHDQRLETVDPPSTGRLRRQFISTLEHGALIEGERQLQRFHEKRDAHDVYGDCQNGGLARRHRCPVTERRRPAGREQQDKRARG